MTKLRESQREGIIAANIFRINRTKDKEAGNKKNIYRERKGGVTEGQRDKHQGNLKER
jgi:hypothetical protein